MLRPLKSLYSQIVLGVIARIAMGAFRKPVSPSGVETVAVGRWENQLGPDKLRLELKRRLNYVEAARENETIPPGAPGFITVAGQ